MARGVVRSAVAVALTAAACVGLVEGATFADFTNTSYSIADPGRSTISWSGVKAVGQMAWPGIDQKAEFVLLPELVSAAEIDGMLALLPEDFDDDKDTVDDVGIACGRVGTLSRCVSSADHPCPLLSDSRWHPCSPDDTPAHCSLFKL
jgi:hypothetical protein